LLSQKAGGTNNFADFSVPLYNKNYELKQNFPQKKNYTHTKFLLASVGPSELTLAMPLVKLESKN